MVRLLLILLVLAGAGYTATAQTDRQQLRSFTEKRLNIQRTGMLVLGGWAISNFIASGWLIGRTEGASRAFHQMNVGWNLVNIGLAGFGYYHAVHADAASLDLVESIRQQYRTEKIFLFNAGLDVGYVLGGLYLAQRAQTTARHPDRLRGFGQSIMLQGGFLFVFDLAMFLIINQHGEQLKPLLQNITLTGNASGIGIEWHF